MTSSQETKIYIPKKLIEVALPLDDINVASAREKSIRHGHPSTLHLWWARRPLATARAVIFAQMVNDPGYQQDGGFKYGVNKKEAEIKREKLFQIIREMVKWENLNNEEVLNRAREAIKESWRETCHLNRNHPQASELFNPEKLPAFHDPFAGGGAIPLEAQRLGLESYASDLNPVAVMINKAMIEIPSKFAGQAPVGPIPEGDKQQKLVEEWSGAKGLAEDVRRYGHWMREEAFKRIGHLYPKVKITDEMISERSDLKPYAGEQLTVIACLWTRTVRSPNPAFGHVDVPLARSFEISSKKGAEAWVEPVIEDGNYRFKVHSGKIPGDAINGTVVRTGGTCILSRVAMPFTYIRAEGKAGRLSERLMAVVAEGRRGRVYLSPLDDIVKIAEMAKPNWKPNQPMPVNPRDFKTPNYGMSSFGDLFTPRQLVSLDTFCDLVQEISKKVTEDAIASGMRDDGLGIYEGGVGATAYADALSVYLTFAVNKGANYWSSLCTWHSGRDTITSTFGRQALPMVWDYAEANPLSNSSGNFLSGVNQAVKVLANSPHQLGGHVSQAAAQTQSVSENKVVSTDPPYYDNIGYADLSDYLYIWMRRCLRKIFPELFGTMAVPKAEELVATPYRHGDKDKAESFFLVGMTQAIHNLASRAHPAFPVSIYYAFKQAETKEGSTSSTGWETFLEAVIQAGFSIVGTWPMKTEYTGNLKKSMNALASSVVMVCQKRGQSNVSISRREFQRELRDQMPEALEAMIGGETGTNPIAPVDLAQAAIGPGMAIYSKYTAVLNQDGTKMSVHDALILINRAITDYLNPDSGNFDADTLFCDDWFSQYGWSAGQFGEANVLAQAKGTSVDGVKDAGVIDSGSGKVRLLKWGEYPQDWDPKTDTRTPVWEACHHMIRVLNQQGEGEAGALLARMPELSEPIRQLAYHLYTLCERKKWTDEARSYNELIGSWYAIVIASHGVGHKGSQTELSFDFLGDEL
jgi:putative DNA methylase